MNAPLLIAQPTLAHARVPDSPQLAGPQRVPHARAADLHEAARIVMASAETALRSAPAGEEAAQ